MKEVLSRVDSTFEAIARKATPKFRTTPGRPLSAGFMAIAYITFGFVLTVIAATGFHYNPSAFKLLLGAVFPVRLIPVTLDGFLSDAAVSWANFFHNLLPAEIATLIKGNLYAFPLVLSAYYIARTFALAKIAKPGVEI